MTSLRIRFSDYPSLFLRLTLSPEPLCRRLAAHWRPTLGLFLTFIAAPVVTHIPTRYLTTRVVVGAAFVLVAIFLVTMRVSEQRHRRQRDTYGSARWEDPHKITGPNAGLLLAQHRSALIHYPGEAHVLSMAPTGTGKGVSAVIPNLLSYPGSVLVTDIKGENYAVTARFRRDVLHQKIAVLDPFHATALKPEESHRFNPLDLIDTRSDLALSDAQLLAAMLTLPEPQSSPFWEDEAQSLLLALILHAAASEPLSRRHLGTVREYLTYNANDWKELLDDMARSKACSGTIAAAGNRLQRYDGRTLSDIVASANRHTRFLDDPHMKAALSSTSIDLTQLKRSLMTVYLILPPDRIHDYNRWARLMIGLCLRSLTRVPKILPHNVLFLLDELPAFGPLQPVEEAVTLIRGYGVTLWMLVQDLAQLRAVYPRTWESLLANTRIKQAFGTADEFTAEYLSKLLGQATILATQHSHQESHTSGTGRFFGTSNRGETSNEGDAHRRLLLPDEIRRLPQDQLLLFVAEHAPYRLARPNYLTHPAFRGRFDPNPMHRTTTN